MIQVVEGMMTAVVFVLAVVVVVVVVVNVDMVDLFVEVGC